jgi:hypothetical protein
LTVDDLGLSVDDLGLSVDDLGLSVDDLGLSIDDLSLSLLSVRRFANYIVAHIILPSVYIIVSETYT